jgi:hypothetical protein
LKEHFDEAWFGDPKIGGSKEARDAAYTDYAGLFRDYFMKDPDGDINLAKSQALNQLRKRYGVTYIKGAGNFDAGEFVWLPVEKARAYQGIENVSDKIAEQAIADIKAKTNQDVDRKSLIIVPVKGTAQLYDTGKDVPYMLSWKDKQGNPVTDKDGLWWTPSANAMRSAQTAARAAESVTGVAAVDARTREQRMRDPAPLQTLGSETGAAELVREQPDPLSPLERMR